MKVVASVVVDAPIEQTYAAFADLDRWPRVLPDTVGVDVKYFDGYNQEFTMTVLRGGGTETVAGFRYCRAPHQLELVQTTPPPVMSRMTGLWDFVEEDGSTRVTASRHFRLKTVEEGGPVATEDEYAVTLGALLRANLRRFKEAIEHE